MRSFLPLVLVPALAAAAQAQPGPACFDPRSDAARAAAGWRPLIHQPGPALAGRTRAPARAPRGVIVAPVGRDTRLPLVGPATDRDPPAAWPNADPFAAPLAITSDPRGRALVRPGPDADGAVVVLTGEPARRGAPREVTLAIGADGLTHLARVRAYLARLPAPVTPSGQETRPRRRLVAAFAHDLDQDGTRELIVRTALEGDAVDGELIVLWADGTSARVNDGSLDGYTLRRWGVAAGAAGPGAIGLVAASLCCDGITVVGTALAPRGTHFAPLEHLVAGGDAAQVCVAPGAGRPQLGLRAADGAPIAGRRVTPAP